MKPLVRMVRYRPQDHPVFVNFARGDNGMLIGSAQGMVGTFGEDPQAQIQRFFVDHEAALEWIKYQCRIYLNREDVDFTMEEGTPMIQAVQGNVGRGPIRPFKH